MRRDSSSRESGENGDVASQRERLTRWLAEWRVDEALGAEPGDRVTSLRSPVRETPVLDETAWQVGLTEPVAAEPPPAVGQIRLFDPSILPREVARPLYVAVLACEAEAAWRVAAFGRFAEPALPGEWLTGRVTPPLRVLCLWNTLRLQAPALARSWVVEAMSDAELRDALAVLAHASVGFALPATVVPHVGPPLFHPDDPRHVYRHREAALMERISQRLAAPYALDEGSSDLRRAAEERDPYGTPPPDKPA